MFYGDDVFNKGFNVVMDSLNTMEHMVKDIGDSSEHIAAAFKTVETMAVASAGTITYDLHMKFPCLKSFTIDLHM